MKNIETKLIEDIQNSEGKEKIKAYLTYSNFNRQSNWQKSLENAQKAREMAIELKEEDLEIEALINISYAYYYHSDFKSANKYVDIFYQKGLIAENHDILCNAYTIKGRIADASGNMSQALDYHLQALDHCLKDPRPLNKMTCYNNLGSCYQELRNYKEAKTYFQLAMDVAEEIKHPGIEIFRMNVGTILYAEEEYEQALKSFSEAAVFFEKNNMMNYLADSYLNIGLSHYLLDDIPLGNEYVEKSYKLKEKLQDYKGVSVAFQVVGGTMLDINELEKAYGFYQKSLQIAETYDLLYEKIETYKGLGKYWELKGDYQKLSEIQKILMELTEENYTKIHDERIAEMETKYKTEIYKLQTRELNAKNKSMQEQIEKLKTVHDELKKEVEESVSRINEQGDLLTSQSRMALMGEMISLIAHQWKQPLNVIGVLAQSFEDAWEFDEMNAEFIEEQVKLIMDQIFYMSETITDFRNFFKSENIEGFDLKGVINKALGLLDYMLKQSAITISTDLSDNCRISGNPNEVIQVVMNIVNNARDAMLENKIPDPEIKLSLLKTDESIKISIFNKGRQIPESIKAKLFEPYFSTKGENGTGIGLYICKMIIENKYKGTIEAVNHSDGVEFIIGLRNCSKA